jgi:hypothetical protein
MADQTRNQLRLCKGGNKPSGMEDTVLSLKISVEINKSQFSLKITADPHVTHTKPLIGRLNF